MSIERLQMPRYGTSDPPWPGLPEGGRLVTVTGANVAPENPAWTDSFKRLQEQGRVVFSAAIEGGVHAKHGTNIDTRLTVIDRVPADDNVSFPTSPGIAPALPTLLGWVIEHVPPRRPVVGTPRAAVPAIATPSTPRTVRGYVTHRQLTAITPAADLAATEVAYARHRLVVDLLRTVGVPAEAAEADAEGMEYHVSDVTLKAFAQFLKSRGWLGGIRALCPPAIECCASGLIHRIQQLQDRRQFECPQARHALPSPFDLRGKFHSIAARDMDPIGQLLGHQSLKMNYPVPNFCLGLDVKRQRRQLVERPSLVEGSQPPLIVR